MIDRLSRKGKKLVVGLMSGTSADGIDAVLVEITGAGDSTAVRLLAFETYPYPKRFRKFLLEQSNVRTARIDSITRLHSLLAVKFAEAADTITRKAGRRLRDVDLIGSHGQTIHHLPAAERILGEAVRSTLQAGNPSIIAKLTGVLTVGDFRSGDVGVGGTGAPLVPYFDYLLFRSGKVSRGLLNIGGISNLTILPKRCGIDSVVAFDCGPGNMLIDACMQRRFNRPFDSGGEIACRGMIGPSVLRYLMRHPYLTMPPPKSTGREQFGSSLLDDILRRSRGITRESLITTLSEFTAFCVFDGYRRFIRRKVQINELLVGGGGVHNQYLMDALTRYFDGITVCRMESAGMDSDAKEAVCFAVLANETIAGIQANVPGATGAKRRTVLGVVCPP